MDNYVDTANGYQPYPPESIPVIVQMMQNMGLIDVINAHVPWSATHSKISPGLRIAALVANALCERLPLYQVATFLRAHPCSALLGDAGLQPEDYNDDALARGLDKLALVRAQDVLVHCVYEAYRVCYAPITARERVRHTRHQKLMEYLYSRLGYRDSHDKLDPTMAIPTVFQCLERHGLVPISPMFNTHQWQEDGLGEQEISLLHDIVAGITTGAFAQDTLFLAGAAFPKHVEPLELYSLGSEALCLCRYLAKVNKKTHLAESWEQAFTRGQWTALDAGISASAHYSYAVQESVVSGHLYRMIILRPPLDLEGKGMQAAMSRERMNIDAEARELHSHTFPSEEAATTAAELFCATHTPMLQNISYHVAAQTTRQRRYESKAISTVPPQNSASLFAARITLSPFDAGLAALAWQKASSVALVRCLRSPVSLAQIPLDLPQDSLGHHSEASLALNRLVKIRSIQKTKRIQALRLVEQLAFLYTAMIQTMPIEDV